MSPSYVELNHTWMDICQCVCSLSTQTGYSLALLVIENATMGQGANELTSYKIITAVTIIIRVIFCAPLKMLQMAIILITIMSKCCLLALLLALCGPGKFLSPE